MTKILDDHLHDSVARLLRGLTFVWMLFFAFAFGLLLAPLLPMPAARGEVSVQPWQYGLMALVAGWLAWRAFTHIVQPVRAIRERAEDAAPRLLSRSLRSAMAPGALIAVAFVPSCFAVTDPWRIAALIFAFGIMHWADQQVPDQVKALPRGHVAA